MEESLAHYIAKKESESVQLRTGYFVPKWHKFWLAFGYYLRHDINRETRTTHYWDTH
jgi:hypothetical protein